MEGSELKLWKNGLASALVKMSRSILGRFTPNTGDIFPGEYFSELTAAVASGEEVVVPTLLPWYRHTVIPSHRHTVTPSPRHTVTVTVSCRHRHRYRVPLQVPRPFGLPAECDEEGDPEAGDLLQVSHGPLGLWQGLR